MKNVNIHVLGVRVHEKPIYRGGGLPRRGGDGTVYRSKRGLSKIKGGVFFKWGSDIPLQTMA